MTLPRTLLICNQWLDLYQLLGLIFIWARDYLLFRSWWRYQMETYSVLLALCEGNPLVTSGFPSQRRSFDVFFDLRLKKRMSKHSRRRWFETPLRPWWRHCNGTSYLLKRRKVVEMALCHTGAGGCVNPQWEWRSQGAHKHAIGWLLR